MLQAADVVLDTFPHGNLVPSIESLYLGTPVVTLGAAHTKGGGGQAAFPHGAPQQGELGLPGTDESPREAAGIKTSKSHVIGHEWADWTKGRLPGTVITTLCEGAYFGT